MKKLITAAVASAFAFLAIGAVNAVALPSGTSLENLTAGEALDPTKDDSGTGSDSTYWLLVGDDQADLLVTNYESGVTLPTRPAQFAEETNNNFLKIETSGYLYRSIGVNSQTVDSFPTVDIDDGIYLDTLVQFTAAEDQFSTNSLTAGDKIAIEYVEHDADETTGEAGYTNFVVRAGYVDAANSKLVATNYFLTFPDQPANEVQFDKTAWHRLTVRAISNVGNAYAPVGFVVYVDGTNLVYKAEVSGGSTAPGDAAYVDSLNSVVKTYLYNSETHALLPSLLRYGETGYDTLSAVAFNGNGCVDDISFTATKPGILPAEGMTVTIAWDDNVASYTVVAGETTLVDGEVVSGEGSTNLLLSAGITAITVTATYVQDPVKYEAGKWSVSAGTLNNGVWTFENGATLTIKSMEPLFDVGGVHYGSFADALDAAVSAGGSATIKLLANINEGVSFTTGEIVLDLNGKTIQGGVSDMYTINNYGAALIIIDSATGGIVAAPLYTGEEDSGALFTESSELTTINAGRFESIVYTPKFQDPSEDGDIVINGGSFYDPDYDPTEPASKFYLYDYLADGVKATYNAGYFTVGEPIIGTYTVTVTPTDNATYAAVYNDGGAAVEFVNDVAAVTVSKTITITATPASGYEYAEQPTGWTLSGGVITKEISAAAEVAIPAPTAVVIGTYSVTVIPTNNTTYAAAYNDGGAAVEFVNDVAAVTVGKTITITVTPASGYEYASAPTGWTLGEGVITKEISAAAEVEIPAPTATSTYPTYMPDDAAMKAKYDAWAVTYGPDTGSTHETAFLLNIDPAAADQTLKAASITISGSTVTITANKALNTVNGNVYIKTAGTLAGLESASWGTATVDSTTGAIEMTSNGTAAFFKIKVDFAANNP